MMTDRRPGRSFKTLTSSETSGEPNALIRRLEGLESLGTDAKAWLAGIEEAAFSVPARTDLIAEGDAPDGLVVILEGMACRFKLRPGGARQITAYLIPGDLCNLDLALRPRMDHAIATLSPCRVARLDFEALSHLSGDLDIVTRAMRRAALVDDAILREWLVNVGSRSAIRRIAHLFCELLMRFRAVGLARGDSYELPVSQLDLAETTGLSTVHVNRTLQELKRQGLIELRARSLMIRNLARLQTLGEFDAGYLSLGEPIA
ncbi:Crp/Fnr family transcriptional regulator [Methylobacterium sp. J-068]|uniref:Crp/Fnr family transcriptional regulator n=1 Tax=Methylobacterium sp. J-068 TaxID=2836649 RepID=UPI001FBB8341|nr:Crp/Fnr family transcriptional regulator [Methylobacterium sp. J-068]MCJ2032896.1 Crp/Fnr family transcriptional regulator [Methylobacterium sp. J-068]